jgi:hypothetical protein
VVVEEDLEMLINLIKQVEAPQEDLVVVEVG